MGYVFEFFILLYIVCTIKTGRSQSKPQLTEVEGITVQPVTTVRQREKIELIDNQPNYHCALIFEGAINRFMIPNDHTFYGAPVWETAFKTVQAEKEFFYKTSENGMSLENSTATAIGQCEAQPMKNNCFSETPFRLYHWEPRLKLLVSRTWVYVAHNPVNTLCRPTFGRVVGNRKIDGSGLSPTRSLQDCAKQVIEKKEGYYGVEWLYSAEHNGTCTALKGTDLKVHYSNKSIYLDSDIGKRMACVLSCHVLPITGNVIGSDWVVVNDYKHCLAWAWQRSKKSISYIIENDINKCYMYDTANDYKQSDTGIGCDVPPHALHNREPLLPIVSISNSTSPATLQKKIITVAPKEIKIISEPLVTTTVAPSTTITTQTTKSKRSLWLKGTVIFGASGVVVICISVLWLVFSRKHSRDDEEFGQSFENYEWYDYSTPLPTPANVSAHHQPTRHSVPFTQPKSDRQPTRHSVPFTPPKSDRQPTRHSVAFTQPNPDRQPTRHSVAFTQPNPDRHLTPHPATLPNVSDHRLPTRHSATLPNVAAHHQRRGRPATLPNVAAHHQSTQHSVALPNVAAHHQSTQHSFPLPNAAAHRPPPPPPVPNRPPIQHSVSRHSQNYLQHAPSLASKGIQKNRRNT